MDRAGGRCAGVTRLVHQDERFRLRGVSLSISYDPTSSTPLGFTAGVVPSWGGQVMSDAEALWGRDTMVGLGSAGPGVTRIALGGRFRAISPSEKARRSFLTLPISPYCSNNSTHAW